ncbi:hypothetical protein M2306_002770 [Myroides gitamensis]|uniref:hypothetical protein n=1 Tax=Myroides odoratus TaxID=256 RepID=UPI0021698AC5|nr:hypothetical protein [Myroides odoratus]MCS4237199.1 hypothetical protein [Myroides odoratus]MDH6602076.1 hypothetical protein [Myroides gitamensis]
MKRVIIFGLLLGMMSSCNKGRFLEKLFGSSEYDLEQYILQPLKSDTLCLGDLERAKQDVSKGKIVFTYPFYFLSSGLRQEKQLAKLCEQHGIVFEYESFSDMFFEGQTQGCYAAYMDQVIAKKFGSKFKENLLDEADQLLIVEQDTIPYYFFEDFYRNKSWDANLPEELKLKIETNAEGSRPFMDIGFYIDQDGKSSGYHLSNFMEVNSEANQKLEIELFAIGVKEIQEYNYWEPGIIKGQKVNTEMNVRIYF